jgi:large subunit ribosomal protein L5
VGSGSKGKHERPASSYTQLPTPHTPRKQAVHAGQKETMAPPRLKELYQTEVRRKIQDQFGIKNPMAVPKIEKVVLNMGMGEAISNAKILDSAVDELGQITGQKPIVTKAKKSIASFKLREGQAIGAMVTLRSEKMWEFLDRLISTALPRVRDFRGVPSKSFDGRGNYTLGVRDHLIFPEIDITKVDKPKGMNITIVTNAKDDDQARFLLRELGLPFTK